MFKSFFPKPGPFFISAFMWSLLAVIFWQAGGGDWLLRVTGASQDVAISAARFWSLNYLVFYAFYVFCVGVFALFWFIYSPHRWQYWSILGTSLIIFVTWFLVEVGVAINAWYAPFYDLIQAALATPHKVSINQFWHLSRHRAYRGGHRGVEQLLRQPLRFPLAYRHERTLYGALAASAPYRRRGAACAGRYHALCFHPGEHGRQLP